jgi:uncharacterized protein (TIGR03083 family)
MTNPAFTDLLTLIGDRSAALRTAAASADADARVPGCPDWSVHDLVAHLGEVQRFWAAAVAAGPSAGPPDDEQVADRTPTGELLAWFTGSTEALLTALREAGPDRGCWTWWESSGAPMTAAAVARHQVQEAAVHARDAQQAAGRPEPLPSAVAADGLDEFLTVLLASSGPWPHRPARVRAGRGRGGRLAGRARPGGSGQHCGGLAAGRRSGARRPAQRQRQRSAAGPVRPAGPGRAAGRRRPRAGEPAAGLAGLQLTRGRWRSAGGQCAARVWYPAPGR